MPGFLTELFDTEGFPARWHCGEWTDLHGWVHVCADLAIFAAYIAIPGSIAYFMWRHREMRLPKLGWLFVAFIFSCGFTHLVEASLFWHPWYRFSGLMKVVTALVSMATVIAIYRKLPDLRKIPSLQRLVEERTKELRASEERSRLIIAGVKDYAIIMLDPEGGVVSWNEGAERIKGYAEGEILGKNFAVFYPPEDVARGIPQRELRRAQKHGHIENEGWRVRKDGTRFWASAVLTAVHDEAGNLHGFSKVTRDITERRNAELKLRAQKELMARLLENLTDGVVACDAQGTLTFFNRAAREWHGADAQAMDQDHLAASYHFFEDDGTTPMERENTPLLRALRGESVRDVKMAICIDGQPPRFLVANGDAYYDADGHTLLGAVCVMQDVTAQRRAREAERIASDRLRLATRIGRVGIWDWKVGSADITINEEAAVIYGLDGTGGSVELSLLVGCLHPEDREKSLATFRDFVARAQPALDLEFRIIRKNDGRERTIRAMMTNFCDEPGRVVRTLGTNFDVTDSRRREQDLADALEKQKELTRAALAGEQAKSEFLAVMSHEIRTPMNGILGFAELLTLSPDLSEEDRTTAQTISTSGKALLRILNDVLDFSRLGAAQLKMQSSGYSPRKLLAEIEALFAIQMAEKCLTFALDVAPAIPEQLEGDEGRLRQILVNLVGNALKFTVTGEISVRCRIDRPANDPQLEIEVADTGPGISARELEKIFEPFQQTDSTLARRHGGAGLGLAISRGLAELMEGTLSVRSQVGRGSIFTLRIPLRAAVSSVVSEVEFPASSLDQNFGGEHPLRILIVEDDRVNLKLVQLITRRLGYEPLIAHNGREAVACYKTEKPDCVLMDIQMPEMDGIEATSKIRDFEREVGRPAAFIIALTANTLPEDKLRCFQAGISAYLNKPIQTADYMRTLRDAHGALASRNAV